MTLSRRNCIRALATVGLTLGTVAFALWVQTTRRPEVGMASQQLNAKTATTTTTSSNNGGSITNSNDCNSNIRLQNTLADQYYQKHNELPRPNVMHAVLPIHNNNDKKRVLEEEQEEEESSRRNNKILVVGDVHGCFDELQELHAKAVQENDGIPFEYVILVGDMCNKGPDSAKVLRWVRTNPNWFSVRGNHDDGALAAALGDKSKREKKKYRWILESEQQQPQNNNNSNSNSSNDTNNKVTLSDEDVVWLSELPYSITIPGSYLGEEEVDTLIVHGGLIPDQELEQQDIGTMITIREVLPVCSKDGHVSKLILHEREKHNAAELHDSMECDVPLPWASVWKGPQRIIFGHDAKRGLQLYPPWAIGLDTGAVYGRGMTAVMLPEQTLVTIDTTEYSSSDN